MLELLSPAGSMEALRAAVQNGANAVYLGYDRFNARMGAQNFSADELQEAIVYCHVRGVQVHLTLNTLVSDREMARAAEVIRAAAVFGVDAFIVQDLGMVQLCKEIAPSVPVHASTQMSIHSLEGVVAAAELGCSRVVLARELPMEQIRHICRRSPVEIEVFVHGALCMCYSGQCYLSSVIGRRSGNRGQCAQPCRLPYGYGRFEATRYPLSLKDNCLIEHVRELERMGVASVKIEGRMKRPEYVAVVTKAYRAAIDGRRVTENDMQQLALHRAITRERPGRACSAPGRSRRTTASCFPLPARRMNRAKARACRSSSTRWCVQESRRSLPRRTRTGMSARRSAPFPSRRWCIL